MSSTPDPEKTRAIGDLDRLTGRFKKAESDRDEARDALQAAIVKHLKARNAPPGVIADHSPYDRVHVGRIGKAGGVEPLPKGPQLEYAPATVDAATGELDELTKVFKKAEDNVDKARDALHASIAKHYAARTLGPSAMEPHTPYKRNRIKQIADEAGAEPIRPAAK